VYVHGVVNLRGKVIPIVDLRRRFGLEQKDADKDTRIVVAELAEKVVGFVVDSVREVLRISRHVTTGPPMMMTRIERQYITGFARLEDRLLMVLELQTVIDADALVGISERPTGCIA
jgi:purine-binding chemotaxis protein CheW